MDAEDGSMMTSRTQKRESGHASVEIGAAARDRHFLRLSIIIAMDEDDPTSPLNLSQSNNLQFYVTRNHALATRVDDVFFQSPFIADAE